MSVISEDRILKLLGEIPDPEVPVISIVELGIVRKIKVAGEIIIEITPTYSGCPAMNTIEQEIEKKLADEGIENFSIKTVYTETWTTDWMSEEAKQKLKDYGIAPPGKTDEGDWLETLFKKQVQCPFCNSTETKLTNQFGSTACKSLHYCNECCQPFEHFKCI